MSVAVARPPPGLEPLLNSAAPVFEPGVLKCNLGASEIPFPPLSMPIDAGLTDKATYQHMYNRLPFQFQYNNDEVPYLHQQVVQLTSKVAELEKWKLQTLGTVCELREQLRRKINDEPLAPPRALVFEQQTSKSPPIKACTGITPRKVPLAPSKDSASVSSLASQDFDAETGLKIYKSSIDADGKKNMSESMRADWTIKNVSTKLRGAMGRPVVSVPFNLHGFEEMRLMVTPVVQASNTGARSRKEKEQFSKMVTDGPLDACLTLKVPNARPCVLKYFLWVGDKRTGPHECNFSNTAIDNRGSFGIDWLLELDNSGITVGVEMLLPPFESPRQETLKEKKDEEMLLLPRGLVAPKQDLKDSGV